MTAIEFAQRAISHAFSCPANGSANDVPVGLVPWTMEALENEALDYIDPNGSHDLEHNEPDAVPNDIRTEAVKLIKDYFKRCK